MKPFRWLAAGLVWVLASVVGLLGVVLCVTIILLPVGLLLISLSRRLYGLAGVLVLPRAVRHPVSELGDTGSKAGRRARKELQKAGKGARQDTRRSAEKVADTVSKGPRRWLG
jgi:hypothetical protein